jgi:hypothetical protein
MKDAVNRPRQPILCDVFDEIKRGFLVLCVFLFAEWNVCQ